MNDHELETALRVAAPPANLPAGLAGHQDRILREAAAGRRRRRGGRVAAAAVLGVALVGVGGSAVAGLGGHETPWGWIAEQVIVNECYQAITVSYDPPLTEDSAIVRDARAYLSSIDIASLDHSAKEAEYLEREHAGEVARSEALREQDAIFATVFLQLEAHLTALGYAEELVEHNVGIFSSSDCSR